MILKNKVVIVTGASSGIGVGIAEVFAEEGAKVICAARREKQGQAVAVAIRKKGGEALFVRCDISQEDQVKALIKAAIDKYGRIDSLINNAGVNFVKPFEELTTEDWDRVIDVDLRGTFFCTRACIKQFLKQKVGNVVNIATVHTAACLSGAAPYDAAKWGMVGLTKSLAVEFASRNIRFNCLSPGLINTQIWQDIEDAAENIDVCHEHWWSNIPMARIGTCREIGDAAAFLASDKASYITGTNLFVDGGMTSLLVSKEGYKSKSLEGK
jgi:NAD(P)-dependent dehydrogenase (short-subunit alcohol dehydrogenase family)